MFSPGSQGADEARKATSSASVLDKAAYQEEVWFSSGAALYLGQYYTYTDIIKFLIGCATVRLEEPLRQDNVIDMVLRSGPVVQGVLYLLLFFSVVSWGIILYKFRRLRRAQRESERFIDIFWETKNLSAIHAASLDMKGSPVAQVFRAGYQELLRVTHSRKQANPGEGELTTELGGMQNVERAMRQAISQEITRLEQALTFLATTASSAPFIGLFGTVWGIMNAFRGLSVTQSSSIQAVAPGIAEALIATAVGLAAAIPAVIAYNSFVRRVRVLSAEMENFAAEFLNIAERHFL